MCCKAWRERAVIDVAEPVIERGAQSAQTRYDPPGVNTAGGDLELPCYTWQELIWRTSADLGAQMQNYGDVSHDLPPPCRYRPNPANIEVNIPNERT
jgi:hypothetical protein